MTDRKKTYLAISILAAVLVAMFSKILFTHQIIRAPDITNEFIWNIKAFATMPFANIFNMNLHAGWDIYANSGGTEGGGTASMQFLFYRSLLFWLIPEPANIAWFILFHLFVGGVGAFFLCRAIKCSIYASLLGGMIFAAAPEIASLINAGHVQKIATISFAPWAFFLLEKGLQSKRSLIWFMSCAVVLAFQFFNMHWQIAYYTCLSLGVYGIARSVMIVMDEKKERGKVTIRIFSLNVALLFFFLSTVAISLIPLSSWSKDTTRGGGAGSTSSGMQVEEAMSWSMPPEEVITFAIPGFFGFSREEGGYNTDAIKAYYWGRMVFTQTTDYMGILPWLLLPLAIIFKRDRYTWLAVSGIIVGLLFSFGKYTPFYWALFNHFPGINNFRVPKMMLFIPTLALGLLAARGLDALLNEQNRATVAFKHYLLSIASLVGCLGLLYLLETVGSKYVFQLFSQQIFQPTRYEQGAELVFKRFNNLRFETALAAIVVMVHWLVLKFVPRKGLKKLAIFVPLFVLYIIDIGRVNSLFMLLQPPPKHEAFAKNEIITKLSTITDEYRVLPLTDEDPMLYASQKIPVMYTSNPVQMRRWQEIIEQFTLVGRLPDMLNVRYLVMGGAQYEKEKEQLADRYLLSYRSSDDKVLLENKTVLPKAWVVPGVVVQPDSEQRRALLNSKLFDPTQFGIVEQNPTIAIPLFTGKPLSISGKAKTIKYEATKIVIEADTIAPSLLVIGDKFYKGWKTTVDGEKAESVPVNHILRGVYVEKGKHTVEFNFDPMPFKIGKILTLGSFGLFVLMLLREWKYKRKKI